MATLAVLALAASACSPADRPPVVIAAPPVKPTLPAAAEKSCARPVALPDRDLVEAEVAAAWGRDRASLLICETRRAAAVAAVKGAAK